MVPMIDASGVRRSWEIDVRSEARSRSVSACRRACVDTLRQLRALDRDSRLVGQRIEQPPLVRREQRAWCFAVDAEHADGAPPRPQRQEQALCTRQRIRAAPGRLIVVPAPACRGEIRIVEPILRWETGAHRDPFALGDQDDDFD